MSVSPTRIVDYLRDSAGRPLRPRELARGLELPEEEYEAFRELLEQLEGQGILYRVKGQRFAVPDKINLVVGRISTIRSGAGFVAPEEGGDDLFIPPRSLGSAVHGDRVVARLEHRGRGQARAEGRVVRVLERARHQIVGVYHPTKNFGFVLPEDRKLSRDFFVPPGGEGAATDGDVVVLDVTFWGDDHKGPAGEVSRILGRLDAPGVDVLAVLHGHGLPDEFPAEVEEEAERLRARGIQDEDMRGRLDLRDRLVFTIDPREARDHDDALSIRTLDGGRWEVGVHIADVGHYVREGTLLDGEARQRATSVYLVDRVVPMLPEALSTDLCSLKGGVDRLALSLMLVVDEEAHVLEHRLARTVVRSAHDLAYEDAQAMLDGQAGPDPDTAEAVRRLAALAGHLRARRQARGSLDFDLPEARVVLGEGGEAVDIQRVLRLEAHRLIEDFMLLANETVAERATNASLPFLYRVHAAPTADRAAQLRDFLGTLGYRVGQGTLTPRDLQRVLAAAEGRPEEALVSTVVLRSMKRAQYTPESLGHFGLAAEHYAHFTSPIRRYADLMVHRLLGRAVIEGAWVPEAWSESLPEIARNVSERERVADEAQRDSIDLKKVEFMERHLGEVFEGTVSGVASFGFFVLLDRFFVEGLVHVSSLEDDYYVYAEEQYALMGERTRRRFQLGGRVRVQVAAVNLEERKMDFVLADD
ncbi:MAG TPA: ribonuclease R [Longimicrobiales bacterium]|nr:ribonuclease R [Longimicrobiales bacterium]